MHPKNGEIILTDTYSDFGNHYMTAIMPAQEMCIRDRVDGLQALEMIREKYNIPVIFVSAKTADQDKIEGLLGPAVSAAGAGLGTCSPSSWN